MTIPTRREVDVVGLWIERDALVRLFAEVGAHEVAVVLWNAYAHRMQAFAEARGLSAEEAVDAIDHEARAVLGLWSEHTLPKRTRRGRRGGGNRHRRNNQVSE